MKGVIVGVKNNNTIKTLPFNEEKRLDCFVLSGFVGRVSEVNKHGAVSIELDEQRLSANGFVRIVWVKAEDLHLLEVLVRSNFLFKKVLHISIDFLTALNLKACIALVESVLLV